MKKTSISSLLSMGIAVGLFCMFTIKHFAISPVFKSNDITNFHFDPNTYNKSCGVSFWRTGKNFNNKDDLHFLSMMTNAFASEKRRITLIEFGANIGQFSEAMFAVQRNSSYTIHSIEPVPGLFHLLKNRSEKFNKNAHDKHYQYNIAISNRIGTLPIFSPAVHTEAASLAKSSKFSFVKIADVAVTTLVEFVKEHRITTPLALVKIDVEGFEPEVILGMDLKNNAQLFPLISFETGGTWRDDRSDLAKNFTLKSFLIMLDNLGYDSYFIGDPYVLPISGLNWDDSFDGFTRSPNVLSVLRFSKAWQRFLTGLNYIISDSCHWK